MLISLVLATVERTAKLSLFLEALAMPDVPGF